MSLNTHGVSLIYDGLMYDDINSMSDDNRAKQLHVDSDDVTCDFSDVTPSQFQYSKFFD